MVVRALSAAAVLTLLALLAWALTTAMESGASTPSTGAHPTRAGAW